MDKAEISKEVVMRELDYTDRKGLVIGTLGRSCKSVETLINMIDSGMTMVRLRLCQGERKKQVIILDYLKEAFIHRPHKKCNLMVDICGRDITINSFEDDIPYIEVEAGEDIEIFIDLELEIKCTKNRLVTSELGLERIIRKGDIIYIGDGQIKATVLTIEDGVFKVRSKSEGRIYEYSSIIVPDKHNSLSVIQEKDIADLEYLAKKHRIDYLSVPYWASDEDIKVVRRLTPFLDQTIILAKIEDKNAAVIKEADGIILQRRALGLSIVSEKLFALQNFLLEQCKLNAKPVLLANEIMDSMVDSRHPDRSEISDIQNALIQGADGVILERETSYGRFPIEAISAVSKAICETSGLIDPYKKFQTLKSVCDFTSKEEILVMNVAKIILDKDREPIDYIMTLSKQGKIARLLAKYCLPIDILACWPDTRIVKQLNLVTGLKAVKVPNYTSKLLGPDHLLQIVIRTNRSMGIGKPGNWIIVFRTKDPKENEDEVEHYFTFEKITE